MTNDLFLFVPLQHLLSMEVIIQGRLLLFKCHVHVMGDEVKQHRSADLPHGVGLAWEFPSWLFWSDCDPVVVVEDCCRSGCTSY